MTSSNEAFDPNAAFVDQETGYAYEDFGAYLVGAPQAIVRNGNITSYRSSKYREDAIKAYWQAFDAESPHYPRDCEGSAAFGRKHKAGVDAANQTGGFGPPHTWNTAETSA